MEIRNEKDAVDAYVAYRGGRIPEGYHVMATCVVDLSFTLPDDSCLWHVREIPDDESGLVFGGTTTIFGPDGRAWTFPANPNLYDIEIMERALSHLYIEGVAELVDAEVLVEQVHAITTQRDAAIFALLDAARRGELRQEPERHQ
jgi:hypothetical protein